ncbi:hypothetical protein HHK36_012813 [Tetracentron sinense]|uniref:RING-type E3 ubiquitin transferase n=1 Tax=Tetracentron sinense TaxID=13715 RepID=A0A835DG22_TETSI|nr:hypothetical protein HHK36_012813 [Tetracentron sinense]
MASTRNPGIYRPENTTTSLSLFPLVNHQNFPSLESGPLKWNSTLVIKRGESVSVHPKYLVSHNEPQSLQQVSPLTYVTTIDLQEFDGPSRPQVIEKLRKACKDDGFFEVMIFDFIARVIIIPSLLTKMICLKVVNHGVSEALMDDMMRVADEFFQIPTENKAQLFSNDYHKRTRVLLASKLARTMYCIGETIFHDDVSGLEIMKDGTWFDVPSLHGAFFVNVGEKRWGVPEYKSLVHRAVTNSKKKKKKRLSKPTFYGPSLDAVIKPTSSVVMSTNVHGPLYEIKLVESSRTEMKLLILDKRYIGEDEDKVEEVGEVEVEAVIVVTKDSPNPSLMEAIHRHFYNHGSHALPPIKTQNHYSYPPPSPSSNSSFPILTIAILGIMATAFLLVSYYIFVIKCCLNWQRIDLLRRFSLSQTRRHEDPLMVYAPARENRGLDESIIRAIPILQFKRGGEDEDRRSSYECAVCLNEFQEEEKLRVLPNCTHAFHIDCIDIWLQNNANCPLCRSSISSTARFPNDLIVAPRSSPQDLQPFNENLIAGDEDYVVIELREESGGDRQRERGNSGEISVPSISLSPRKLDQRLGNKKLRKFHHVSSMGDECIDVRAKDDQFSIQPIRRSFSMDSSADPQLYLSVQEIIQQNMHFNEVSTSEGCSSRVRRSFFSFGHGRGARNAVLPIQFDP